jgi:hypothetical protein
MHDEREGTLIMILEEEDSELQVLQGSLGSAPIWHYGDHDTFLLDNTLESQGLDMGEIVDQTSR